MATAFFPASTWDGSSATRSATLDKEPISAIVRAPDSADWDQSVAEIQAIETTLTTTSLIAGANNTAALATAPPPASCSSPRSMASRPALPRSSPPATLPRHTTMPTTRSTCTTAAGRPPQP